MDLDFADDIAVLSEDMEKAQRLLSATEEWALSVGLCIKKGKTEYLRLGEPAGHAPLRVNEGEIKEVEGFKYLGSWVMTPAKDFNVRRAQAFAASDRMWRVWKSNCSRAVKMRHFKAYIEPILLCGTQTWTLTKTPSN